LGRCHGNRQHLPLLRNAGQVFIHSLPTLNIVLNYLHRNCSKSAMNEQWDSAERENAAGSSSQLLLEIIAREESHDLRLLVSRRNLT
jgi:hypothetical protein